jgi:hypothetical protein
MIMTSIMLATAGALFVALFLLALYHFLYESVIAPSLRDLLSFKLFALRDDLRRLRLAGDGECDGDVFEVLQESLNSSINLTRVVDLRFVGKVKKLIASDKAIRLEVERRRQMLAASPNPNVRQIREKQIDLMIWAILINHGGWLLYVCLLLPLFLFATLVSRWKHGFLSMFRQIEGVVYLPEEQTGLRPAHSGAVFFVPSGPKVSLDSGRHVTSVAGN